MWCQLTTSHGNFSVSIVIVNQISLIVSWGHMLIQAIPGLVPPSPEPCFFQGKGLSLFHLPISVCSLQSLPFWPCCILPFRAGSNSKIVRLWIYLPHTAKDFWACYDSGAAGRPWAGVQSKATDAPGNLNHIILVYHMTKICSFLGSYNSATQSHSIWEAPAVLTQSQSPVLSCSERSLMPCKKSFAIHCLSWLSSISFTCYWQDIPTVVLHEAAPGYVNPSSPCLVRKPPCSTLERKPCMARSCLEKGQDRHSLSVAGARRKKKCARVAENMDCGGQKGIDGEDRWLRKVEVPLQS